MLGEHALVVRRAPLAGRAIDAHQVDGGLQAIGRGLKAVDRKAHAVAVVEPRFGQQHELTEMLAWMQDDDILDGQHSTKTLDSRRAEDLGVAVGVLVPACHGARVRRVGRAGATVIEAMKAQGRIEHKITARSRRIAACEQTRRN